MMNKLNLTLWKIKMITINIPYSIIVTSEDLCEEVWINERTVNEWVVDWDDTATIEITSDNVWILDYLIDYLV